MSTAVAARPDAVGPNRRVGVVVFPGSNCDTDAGNAVRGVMEGCEPVYLWHADTNLPSDVDAVIVPGGFSYGDALRAGAIARFAPLMSAVTRFAEGGGLVLGVCNGFQILCEAGLLPGALARNQGLRFVCRPVYLRVETIDSPFTHHYEKGQVLRVPVAHGEGCFTADAPTLAGLREADAVLFRYCDVAGQTTPSANPNGSLDNIAGIVGGPARNVLGMMPHPERAISAPSLGSDDGLGLFSSLRAALLPLKISAASG